MNINVITYGERINHAVIASSTVIVIDVLRCTSAIIAALENGAEKIVPAFWAANAAATSCPVSTWATRRLNTLRIRWRGRPL